VRGKFRAMLRQKCPDLVIPEAVWRRPWILHVTAWGNGEQAVLDYLDEETVTIQYKDRKTRPRANLPTQRRRVHAPLPPVRVSVTSAHADETRSSMCCRAASTRSVTSVCIIPYNATMPHGCVDVATAGAAQA
jgi:hypothetical protein